MKKSSGFRINLENPTHPNLFKGATFLCTALLTYQIPSLISSHFQYLPLLPIVLT
jgi:hypothetical protein